MTVCTSMKKRKVFDITKARTQGTDLEKYVSKAKKVKMRSVRKKHVTTSILTIHQTERQTATRQKIQLARQARTLYKNGACRQRH